MQALINSDDMTIEASGAKVLHFGRAEGMCLSLLDCEHRSSSLWPQIVAGGKEVFGKEFDSILSYAGLTDPLAIEKLRMQAIKCSADLTIRQLFG